MRWINGLPTNDGIYWYDNGLGSNEPLVAQRIGDHIRCFGDGGSCPITMIYGDILRDRVKHARIDPPKHWYKFDPNVGYDRSWVKLGRYIGVSLLPEGNNAPVGTIVWLNNPTISSESGVVLNDKRYRFHPLNVPVLPQNTEQLSDGFCDRCSSPVVKRQNRTSGNWFYGCGNYPTCRWTTPITTRWNEDGDAVPAWLTDDERYYDDFSNDIPF